MWLAGTDVPEEQITPVFLHNLKIYSLFLRNTGTDLPDDVMETVFVFCLPSTLIPKSNEIITTLKFK